MGKKRDSSIQRSHGHVDLDSSSSTTARTYVNISDLLRPAVEAALIIIVGSGLNSEGPELLGGHLSEG